MGKLLLSRKRCKPGDQYLTEDGRIATYITFCTNHSHIFEVNGEHFIYDKAGNTCGGNYIHKEDFKLVKFHKSAAKAKETLKNEVRQQLREIALLMRNIYKLVG